MFMRLLILESDKNSLWIKLVGAALISLRFADWPYELSFTDINQTYLQESSSLLTTGSTCWAIWPHGVIILNFIADALANLFLSGMFVRRLYVHIRQSRKAMNHRNCVIEYIARKSLICLALTFVVNLIMNLFKVTMFLGVRSDAFTVYFSIIESTLLVEALRVDHQDIHNRASCQQCKQTCYTDMERHGSNSGKDDLDEPKCYTPHDDDDDDDDPAIRHTNKLRLPDSHHSVMELTPINTISPKSITLVNKKINQLYPPPITTHYSYQHVSAPYLKSSNSVLHTSSAPPFAITKIQPVVRSSGVIEAVPTMSLGSIEFDDKIKWKSTGRSGKQHQH
ncbi:hypothetical protein BC941DRAFT_346315 [Chlamydoabsidia padenii]|nr:hypothetical protein BC941DRAFT_346315 [Chlamydoabsidia padenii]